MDSAILNANKIKLILKSWSSLPRRTLHTLMLAHLYASQSCRYYYLHLLHIKQVAFPTPACFKGGHFRILAYSRVADADSSASDLYNLR